jgi:hypothetical protein
MLFLHLIFHRYIRSVFCCREVFCSSRTTIRNRITSATRLSKCRILECCFRVNSSLSDNCKIILSIIIPNNIPVDISTCWFSSFNHNAINSKSCYFQIADRKIPFLIPIFRLIHTTPHHLMVTEYPSILDEEQTVLQK